MKKIYHFPIRLHVLGRTTLALLPCFTFMVFTLECFGIIDVWYNGNFDEVKKLEFYILNVFYGVMLLQIGSTWSNLAGVNINIDDLSLSSSKKSPGSTAPSMNQLATSKPIGKQHLSNEIV